MGSVGKKPKAGDKSGKKPPGKAGQSSSRRSPTKDAPFGVDPDHNGDFASPKPTFDEDELKDEEDRRM